ncbi:radical SAM/Cys-rich domain protein [Desulfuromonas versatilis]|uniref:Radical SAM/Cys-rich domain protein n=1 Tax=Desulfuromonas versatilis TaxID=2802975 RepID=A0ABN6DTG3_9BACT|nr:radical SAM/Cys-rich domain protein [Desulfuromonas versatilis]
MRGETHTLQVNVGLLCNQACRHCHLEAGPTRREVMSRATMNDVIAYARRVRFEVIDITGGAPEMVPDIEYLIGELAPLTPRLMLRSNLTALGQEGRERLLELCVRQRVVIVSSFPATNPGQTDSQRGQGVWEQSIAMLRRLNEEGYGIEGSGLELDLVANPAGAFLPTSQQEAERKFKRDLERKFGIVFNHIYTFANMPLGRFRAWLEKSGNYRPYMEKLAQSFNPCTVSGLMCRTLVSVSWDGYLYDCDFNQAEGLPLGGEKIHVAMMPGLPEPGTPIAVGDHCYACTAGSGFT